MVAIVLNWSNPSTSIPSASISVNPNGPTMASIPFSFPHCSTAFSKAEDTSSSSMKSSQPKRTSFLFQVSFARWLMMAATRPTISSPLYARKYSASQNSNAGFFLGLKVFSMSSYKSGTE